MWGSRLRVGREREEGRSERGGGATGPDAGQGTLHAGHPRTSVYTRERERVGVTRRVERTGREEEGRRGE